MPAPILALKFVTGTVLNGKKVWTINYWHKMSNNI